MKRSCKWVVAAWLGMGLLLGSGGATAWAAPQGQKKPAYTLAEYNAYQAAHNEKDPQAKVKQLDDFVAKYPNSALLPYVYRDYYLTYYSLKNYPKTIEYVDHLLSLGNKIDLGTRLEALVARAQAFFIGSSDKALQTPDALTKTSDASAEGLKTLAMWQKPAKMSDEQFAAQKKSIGLLFNSVAGIAESQLKDYPSAVNSYKAALALAPNDAVTHYRLGIAYLEMNPPQEQDGFWELARSIALKGPGAAQVQTYLRNQVLHYQMLGCDKLVDDEISQLITLAGTSAQRPATLNIPSADDLTKVRSDTTDFLPWLEEGGDHGKQMWLATCGLEFPDVPVRIMSVVPGDDDNLTLNVFRGSTEQEMLNATDANMLVHIVSQPEAKRLSKDDYVRFTATLTGYQQNPFMLTWDNGKVNPMDIPAVKGKGAKRPRGAPAK
jgi:tetratricopeptide (TPR) repeat protein